MADEPELQQSPAEDETVNDRGQRLVAVPAEVRKSGRPRGSKNKPRTEEFRSIDDVVSRHISKDDVHTADAEVPPSEPDPARRMKPTVGRIELTPDAYDPDAPLPPEIRARVALPVEEVPDLSDGQLRTLEDLNARFDFDGSGQFYIMVTRQKPMHLNGILTTGRMRNVTTSLTHEEFCEFYGGGQYQLIVYGPPARGRLIDPVTNKPKPKALSKPITVIVPYQGEGGRDPNPLAALEYEDPDLDGMRGQHTDVQGALLQRRTNGLADAKIFEAATQKELTMDQRQREDRREEIRERREQETTAVGVVRESSQEVVKVLQRQVQDLKEELKQAAHGKSNGTEVVSAMAQMVSAMGPRVPGEDELQRMRQSYEERIKNLTEAQVARMRDVDERHKRETDDRERGLMREKEDAIRRAEDAARYANQQMEQRSVQLTAERDREREDSRKERERLILDHQRDVDLLKKDHERDIARQKEHYDNLLTVERNTNQRDREMLKESLGTKGELLKATAESELRAANNEVTRLRADNERLKSDLDKKSNLPKQIKEFEDAAGAMGLVRDEGGREQELGWKQTLLRAGATAVEKLPEIIENAGKVVAMTRGAATQGPAAQRPAPGGMPPPRAFPPPPAQGPHAYPVTHVPPVWATEDSAPPGGPLPEQFQPVALPPPAVQQPAVAQPLPAPIPMPVQVRPTAAPPTVNQGPAPQVQQRPPPPPSGPPPAAPQASAPPAVQVSDEDILRFAPTLEEWFGDDKTPPEVYALQYLALDPNLRLVATSLTPEAVATALQRHGRGRSPLVRRDGQRFLKRFRDAILGAPS